MHIAKPDASEHSPYMSLYVNTTEQLLAARGDSNLLAVLEEQPAQLRALLSGIEPSLASFAYAPGKWTLSESLLHVADTERVFSYRLTWIARGDKTPLPGFEQNDWVPESRAGQRTLWDIVGEIEAVRASTIAFVRSLDDTGLAQIGTSNNNPLSARALTWIIAGHFAHHLVLTKTRYLSAANAR